MERDFRFSAEVPERYRPGIGQSTYIRQEIVEDRETPRAAVHAVTKNWTQLGLNRSPGRRKATHSSTWPREFHRL